MSSFSQKLLVVLVAVAMIGGGVWYIQRNWVPKNVDDIRADPEVEQRVQVLLRKSLNSNIAERTAILNNICDMGYRAIPVIVYALEDPDPRMRAFAANILQHSGNLSVVPHLEARLADEDPVVRRTALAALGELGASSALPTIIVVLDDKDRFTRCQAALVLGTLRRDGAVAPLINTLENDPYPVARRTAANSLGEIGDERAIPSLIDSLEDDNHVVRSASMVALNRITEASLGSDKDAWTEWWNKRQAAHYSE